MRGQGMKGLWPGEIPFAVLTVFTSVGAAFEIAYGRPDLLPSLVPLGLFMLLYAVRRFSSGGSGR